MAELSFTPEGLPVVDGTRLEWTGNTMSGLRTFTKDDFPYLISQIDITGVILVNSFETDQPFSPTLTKEGFDSIAAMDQRITFGGASMGQVTFDKELTRSLNNTDLEVEKNGASITVKGADGNPVITQNTIAFEVSGSSIYTASGSQLRGQETTYSAPDESSTYFNRITRNTISAEDATATLQNQFEKFKTLGCASEVRFDLSLNLSSITCDEASHLLNAELSSPQQRSEAFVELQRAADSRSPS